MNGRGAPGDDSATGEDWADRAPDAPELAAALRAVGRIAAAHAAAGGDMQAVRPDFEWGHLQVFGRIGAGSYGEVYRAFDPVLQRNVALKLLRLGADHALASRDFILEARRMARVRHPNVLAVHGADYHEGRVGLWADLIEGRTLEQRLRAGRIPADECLRLALQLAAALRAVHAAALVHGDVKASNVMLEPAGRAVLMDFGAGREASDHGGLRAVGSPLSMAPEQFEGAPASEAADQYAFGALIFRCLTGRHVVEGSDFESLRSAHAARRAIDFRDAAAGTEPALVDLVRRLLSAQVAQRPDAKVCVATLREIAALPAMRARRRLRAALVASLAIALAATSAGLWQSRVQTERARGARAESEAVNAFLTDLLASPRMDDAGDRVRMIDVVDAAARDLAGNHALRTEQRAAVAEVLGQTYQSLDRYADAVRWYGYALSELRQAPDSANRRLDIELARLRAMAQDCTRPPAKTLLDELGARAAAGSMAQRISFDEAAADAADCAGDLRGASLRLEAAVAKAAAGDVGGLSRESIRLRAALGAALVRGGELKRATTILEEALSAVDTRVPAGDSVLLAVRYNLAIAYGYAGRNGEAERMMRASLDIARERTAEPYYLARFEGALGGLLYDLGRSREALEHMDAALALLRPRVGPDAYQVLVIEGNRGNALKAMGRFAEAEAAYRMAIDGLSRAGGVDANHALLQTFNLVELLNDTGRHAEAAELARTTLERATAAFGEEHLVTLELRDALGVARLALGDAADAVALHRRVLEAKQRTLGDDSQYTLLAMHRLARALHRQGRHAEAAELVGRAAVGLARTLGPDHPFARAASADRAAWSRVRR